MMTKFKEMRKNSYYLRRQAGVIHILLILGVLIVGGVVLIFGKDKLNSIVQIGNPSPVATNDSTSDWKIYTDEKNMYSFKYPSNLLPLNLDYGDHGPIAFFENQSDLTACRDYKRDTIDSPCFKQNFSVNKPNVLTENEYLNSNFYTNKLDPKTYIDSNKRSWETDMVLGEVYNFTGVFKENNKYYLVSMQSGTSYIEYSSETGTGDGLKFRNFANQILSTFKFE